METSMNVACALSSLSLLFAADLMDGEQFIKCMNGGDIDHFLNEHADHFESTGMDDHKAIILDVMEQLGVKRERTT